MRVQLSCLYFVEYESDIHHKVFSHPGDLIVMTGIAKALCKT